MNKIPEDFKIASLEGELISQIAYGINYISIFFDKGFIQIEGRFKLINRNIHAEYDELYPVNHDFGLLLLLEKKISKVIINKDRDRLALLFNMDLSLEIISDKEYESFRISISGNEYII
ncbi:MAG: hypothetical protein AUJ98_05200 [Bacteroidetes bacterium CG2_30_33_31]|nr:MAG: hypothetical protein AUJ98_05200 [Bacteroidetes bacterium CG2_30_33_31]